VVGRLCNGDLADLEKMVQVPVLQDFITGNSRSRVFIVGHNPRYSAENFSEYFLTDVRPSIPGSICLGIEQSHKSILPRSLGPGLDEAFCDGYGLGNFIIYLKVHDIDVLHYLLLDEGIKDDIHKRTEVLINYIAVQDLRDRINRLIPSERLCSQPPLLKTILQTMESLSVPIMNAWKVDRMAPSS
jgi:hypothetical protein